MFNNKRLGEVLVELRKHSGLTQAQLAEQASTSTNTYHLVEKGTRNPSDALLEKIAGVYGVPASVLRLVADDSRLPFVRALRNEAEANLYDYIGSVRQRRSRRVVAH